MPNTGRWKLREGRGFANVATLATAALACAGAEWAWARQAAPPAGAAQTESRPPAARGACTLVGNVPVLPRKAAGASKGTYTGKAGERAEPADQPSSAVWMVGDFAPADPAFTKPAVLARRTAVGLPETFEDVRQELRRDADAAILHVDAHLAIVDGATQPDLATRRRELHRVGEDVAKHLLQPLGVAGQ